MQRTDVVIVGAGQAGLALSHSLSARGIDHVLLERGRVAESWRSERWDSLRLITPNWMTRLPGHVYAGDDPDGFMHRDQVVAMLDRYAAASAAPVIEGAAVRAVTSAGAGYRLETGRGAWSARAVVVATGACGRAAVPGFAAALPPTVAQLTPPAYRRPGDLPPGGVLVVGASASGLQLAREIHASGRPVTLAAGRHQRLPRRYRGRDIHAWLDATGISGESWQRIPDLAAARRQPSPQLSAQGPLDLARLAAEGVRVTGRVLAAEGGRLALGDNLAADCATSDARLLRLLDRIDAFAARRGIAAPEDPAGRARPSHPQSTLRRLDLAAEGIRSVVWATGFRGDYGWLGLPVLDAAGEIAHRGGVTAAPGVYALGLRLLCRRSSAWIDGAGRDAGMLAAAIARQLGARMAA
jgi:putative flavoprotein involved in K+ transport